MSSVEEIAETVIDSEINILPSLDHPEEDSGINPLPVLDPKYLENVETMETWIQNKNPTLHPLLVKSFARAAINKIRYGVKYSPAVEENLKAVI